MQVRRKFELQRRQIRRLSFAPSLNVWLSRPVREEGTRVSDIVEVELLPVYLAAPAALTEGEGTVSNTTCDVHGIYPVEANRVLPDPTTGSFSGHP